MRNLWIYLFPFLFLPNLGLGVQTPFGKLELMDFIMFAFLAVTFLARAPARRHFAKDLRKYGLLFIVWLLAGCFVMYYFHGYDQKLKVMAFSLLKVGKFSLYGYTALRLAKLMGDDATRNRFNWSLLFASAIVGLSLIIVLGFEYQRDADTVSGYKATNLISAALSIYLSYLSALYFSRVGDRRWQKYAGPFLVLGLVGMALSSGRGGWLALACGIFYYVYKRGVNAKVAVVFYAFMAGATGLYFYSSNFRAEVLNTFFPDVSVMQYYGTGIAGINEGGRLMTWANEIKKFPEAPVMGTGFFNRSPATGLWPDGSHNFWLQMFLETGLVGGILVLFLFWKMWGHSGLASARARGLSIPVRSALVAAFVAGMGGEYFYGSQGLFALLTVYAIAGSLDSNKKITS